MTVGEPLPETAKAISRSSILTDCIEPAPMSAAGKCFCMMDPSVWNEAAKQQKITVK
jgi:hypothetical protein